MAADGALLHAKATGGATLVIAGDVVAGAGRDVTVETTRAVAREHRSRA